MRSSWQLRDQADRILNRRQAQSPPPGSRLPAIIASGHKGDNAPTPGGTHGDSGRISAAAPRYRSEARSSGRRAEVPPGLSRQRARTPRYVTPVGGFFAARVWMLLPVRARPLCSRLCASLHHTRPAASGQARRGLRSGWKGRPPDPRPSTSAPRNPGSGPRSGDLPKPTWPARSNPGRGCPPTRGGTAAAR